MKKWKGRIKASLSDLPVFVLAWAAQVMAFLGGSFAAATIIGDTLRDVLGWIPDNWGWMTAALLFLVTLGVALDLLWDALPERIALWGGFAAPLLASAVPNKFGDTVTGWADSLEGSLEGEIAEWFGGMPALGLTVVCLIGVVLTAKYALPKSGERSPAEQRRSPAGRM